MAYRSIDYSSKVPLLKWLYAQWSDIPFYNLLLLTAFVRWKVYKKRVIVREMNRRQKSVTRWYFENYLVANHKMPKKKKKKKKSKEFDVWKCKFFAKCDFENVNFVKNETLKTWIFWKMWILWKMRLRKCEFCEKWGFENVNFVKNVVPQIWILSKMRLWKCEFCQNEIFKMWIFGF